MKFTKHLFLGYRNYINAFKFIIVHNLWRYFLFPLILFGLIFYTGHYFEELRNESSLAMTSESISFIEKMGLWIKKMFQGLASFIFLDATKYVIMIILSPLIALLSEKVETIITGNQYKFNLIQLIKDIKRGIGIAIRMLLAETIMIYLIWWPISWVFGVSDFMFETVAIFIGFYFYGFGFIDYINERLRLTIKESWSFMKKHSGLAIAIGSVFSLLFYIPSLFPTGNIWGDVILDNVGVIFAPVLAIVAATLSMHDLINLNSSKYAVKKENEETSNP